MKLECSGVVRALGAMSERIKHLFVSVCFVRIMEYIEGMKERGSDMCDVSHNVAVTVCLLYKKAAIFNRMKGEVSDCV